MAKHKKMALGRGLGEILGEVKQAYEKSIGENQEGVMEISINHSQSLPTKKTI